MHPRAILVTIWRGRSAAAEMAKSLQGGMSVFRPRAGEETRLDSPTEHSFIINRAAAAEQKVRELARDAPKPGVAKRRGDSGGVVESPE